MADTIFDNTAAGTQRSILGTSGIQTFSFSQDSGLSLDAGDTEDYFKLTVSRSSNVVVKLYQDAGDASISLLDYTADPNNPVVAGTNNPTGFSEAIVTDQPLSPNATYYIRVSAANPTSTINYTLSVETVPETQANLLWRSYSTGSDGIWLLNDTTFAGTKAAGPSVDPSWRLEGTGDFNGDGNADYIWHNTSDGTTGIWLMDATGNTIQSVVSLNNVPGEWYVGGVADFNGDGQQDIYWRNYSTGDAGVWLMNGTTYTGILDIDNIKDPSWRVQAVADFNGDGKADLFFRNVSTGANGIWLMNGNRFQAAVSLAAVDTSWSVGGAGDFNGDGNTDLVWRDYASGSNGIWLMNQTTFVNAISLPSVSPSTSYVIAGVVSTKGAPDVAGNSTGDAFSIGRLTGTANYSDRVGGSDPSDYYAFTLTSSAKIDASISGLGLSANTTLEILRSDGSVVTGATISDANTESIQGLQIVNPGTYYVRVVSTTGQKQDYSLTIAAAEQLPVNIFFPPSQGTTPSIVLKDTNGTPITGTVSVLNNYPFQVSYNLEYTGRTLSDFKVAFFLSTDATIDASDYRLDVNNDGQRNTSDFVDIQGADVLPDTIISRTTSLFLPNKNDPYWVQDGTYYIGIIIDPENEIEEKDQQGAPKEDDNTISTSIKVKDARRPDLTSTSFDVVESNASIVGTPDQQKIHLTGSVANIGNANTNTGNAAGTFTVNYYISQDNKFDNNDLLLTTADFTPLAAGASVNFNSDIGYSGSGPVPPAFFENTDVVLDSGWSGWRLGTTSSYFVVAVINQDGGVQEFTGGDVNNTIVDSILVTA